MLGEKSGTGGEKSGTGALIENDVPLTAETVTRKHNLRSYRLETDKGTSLIMTGKVRFLLPRDILIEEESLMVYHGKVKNGVVVFEKDAGLPDGTEVRVEPFARDEGASVEGPTLAQQFADVIGTVPELPADMAAQHDHYLHGAPKYSAL